MRLYHVTPTSRVRSIKHHGIRHSMPSNWVKQGNGEPYGKGFIFAFEDWTDALRWAGRMDWELHQATGTGNISIVTLRSTAPWDLDDADPLSQGGRKGRWLKSRWPVPNADIIKAERVTTDMLRTLNQ